MKLSSVVVIASLALGLLVAERTPLAQSADRPWEDASALLPPGFKIDQFAVTADGKRTYFVDSAGALWLYAQSDKTATRLATGPVWDLDASRTANAVAFTKTGAHRGDQHVWVLPLDPTTGVARGSARQIGASSSDVPSISPDGQSVAFGRDDPNGVGQTLVIAPIGGGAERAVAPRRPSSLASIRWTPDGKSLYYGVNLPVACVPGWSCLPLAPDLRDPLGAIERVAAKGGPIASMATARGAGPGLSPDGRTLVYLDIVKPPTRQWVIANADGTRRDTLTLRPSQTPVGWLRGSVVLIQTVITGSRGRDETLGTPSIVSMDLAASRSQQR